MFKSSQRISTINVLFIYNKNGFIFNIMYSVFFIADNFSGFNPILLYVIFAIYLIITSKNPIISVLYLILLFGSISCYLVLARKRKTMPLFNLVLYFIVLFYYNMTSLYNKYYSWIVIVYILLCIINIIIDQLNLNDGFLYMNKDSAPSGPDEVRSESMRDRLQECHNAVPDRHCFPLSCKN